MLNKKICFACRFKDHLRVAYLPSKQNNGYFVASFENDWEQGYVVCPFVIKRGDPMKFHVGLEIAEHPPEKCPWILEHVVIKDGK